MTRLPLTAQQRVKLAGFPECDGALVDDEPASRCLRPRSQDLANAIPTAVERLLKAHDSLRVRFDRRGQEVLAAVPANVVAFDGQLPSQIEPLRIGLGENLRLELGHDDHGPIIRLVISRLLSDRASRQIIWTSIVRFASGLDVISPSRSYVDLVRHIVAGEECTQRNAGSILEMIGDVPIVPTVSRLADVGQSRMAVDDLVVSSTTVAGIAQAVKITPFALTLECFLRALSSLSARESIGALTPYSFRAPPFETVIGNLISYTPVYMTRTELETCPIGTSTVQLRRSRLQSLIGMSFAAAVEELGAAATEGDGEVFFDYRPPPLSIRIPESDKGAVEIGGLGVNRSSGIDVVLHGNIGSDIGLDVQCQDRFRLIATAVRSRLVHVLNDLSDLEAPHTTGTAR